MISIASPMIEDEEVHAVNAVLSSGQLAQGPKVAEFEKAFAQYCGTKYALAVSSGTAALHAALLAAGVGPGDEVITTPFTFIATINCIIMTGAKPVLVDIDPVTYNIDTSKIEERLTFKTKAILPVHLFGQPSNADIVAKIARDRGLVVIEDACQAVGATFGALKAGNLGDMGCFSLYATKNIISGEGGMVTTSNDAFAEAIRLIRQHGMSGPYQYERLGYNYRLTDLHAAVGVEQLKKVEKFNKKRRQNAALLNKGLMGLKGISIPMVAEGRTHVYNQYTIRLDKDFAVDRQTFIDVLKQQGVGAGIYYPLSLHTVPHIAAFGYKVGDFPEAEKAAKEVVSLPIHPRVSRDDIRHIIAVIQGITNG